MKRANRTTRSSTLQKADARAPRYVFHLYVSGTTPRSIQAIRSMRRICEEHLTGQYDLEVVDIYQQPERARDDQIVAAPTLIKSLPLPLRRFIGDMSESDRLMIGIGLQPATGGAT